MPTSIRYCEAHVLVVEHLIDKHGSPLPNRLLTLGDPEDGWGVVLNPTDTECDGIPRFHIKVTWNGFPVGIIGPCDGTMIDSEANEESLCEWLQAIKPDATPEP